MFRSALFCKESREGLGEGRGERRRTRSCAPPYVRVMWRLGCAARVLPCSHRMDIILSPRISSCRVIRLIVTRVLYRKIRGAGASRNHFYTAVPLRARELSRPDIVFIYRVTPTMASQFRNYRILYAFVH